jgi:hypothetical protein
LCLQCDNFQQHFPSTFPYPLVPTANQSLSSFLALSDETGASHKTRYGKSGRPLDAVRTNDPQHDTPIKAEIYASPPTSLAIQGDISTYHPFILHFVSPPPPFQPLGITAVNSEEPPISYFNTQNSINQSFNFMLGVPCCQPLSLIYKLKCMGL